MTEEELYDRIQSEASQHIPFDIADVNLDHQLLESVDSQMDVLLVAVKKDKILNHTNVLAQAGKNSTVVDIDAFALQNCYEVNYDPDPGQTVALLNIGASVMNINIVRGGIPLFTRDVSVGGNQYTDALQKELDLSFEDAERLKHGENIAGVAEEHRATILRSVTDILVLEIQKTFDFFRATATGENIQKIVVAGGSARVPGLMDVLREEFAIPVEEMYPFRKIVINPASTTKNRFANSRRAWPLPWDWRSGVLTNHDSDQLTRENAAKSHAHQRAAGGDAAICAPRDRAGREPRVLYGHYLLLDRENTKVLAHIQKQTGEKARLEQLKQQVDNFEKQRAVLQQRIGVIEGLQRNRTGGQELLEAIANTVSRTDTLWLTSVDRKGDDADHQRLGRIDQCRGQLHHPTQALRLFPARWKSRNRTRMTANKAVQIFVFSLTAQFGLPQAAGTAPATTGAAAPRRQPRHRPPASRGRSRGSDGDFVPRISVVSPGADLLRARAGNFRRR